jgi:putative aldouronate transport system substrate-binding protein
MNESFFGLVRKSLVSAAAFVLAAVVVHAAGGSAPAVSTSEGLPIVKTPITLTRFETMEGKVAMTMKSYGEMACYKELEKRTGITIKWIHPPIGQEQEQFNLVIASGDYPDMIFWDLGQVPGGPATLLSNNVILKLNDLVDQFAPNLKATYVRYPEARKQATRDDGTQYMFPFLQLDPATTRAGGPIIRRDWLVKLGLSSPKTIQDWYVVLKAFKEKDPNGNGKADEIPLIAQKGNSLEGYTSWTAPFGIIQGFYNDHGVAKFGPIEYGYKLYLANMNKWYSEGLLDADFATCDGKNFDAKVTSDRAGSYIGRINNTLGRYMTLVRPNIPTFDLIGTAWPIGPAGKPYNIRSDMLAMASGTGTAITTKNKHVQETVRWLDYQYGTEGSLLMNWGIEGQSFTMVNNKPQFTDYIAKNPKGLALLDALAQFAPSSFQGNMAQEPEIFYQSLTWPQQRNTVKIWAAGGDTSLLLPQISPSPEESKRMGAIMNDINTYVAEMSTKFIMGAEPVSRFDEFVANIKNMGIEEALKIENAALSRYNNKK